jgi:hypothetical protein
MTLVGAAGVASQVEALLRTAFDISEFAFRNLTLQMPTGDIDTINVPDAFFVQNIHNVDTSDSTEWKVKSTDIVGVKTEVLTEDAQRIVTGRMVRYTPLVIPVLSLIMFVKIVQCLDTSSTSFESYVTAGLARLPENQKRALYGALVFSPTSQLLSRLSSYFDHDKISVRSLSDKWCSIRAVMPKPVSNIVAATVHSMIVDKQATDPSITMSVKLRENQSDTQVKLTLQSATEVKQVSTSDDAESLWLEAFYGCGPPVMSDVVQTIGHVQKASDAVDEKLTQYMRHLETLARSKASQTTSTGGSVGVGADNK